MSLQRIAINRWFVFILRVQRNNVRKRTKNRSPHSECTLVTQSTNGIVKLAFDKIVRALSYLIIESNARSVQLFVISAPAQVCYQKKESKGTFLPVSYGDSHIFNRYSILFITVGTLWAAYKMVEIFWNLFWTAAVKDPSVHNLNENEKATKNRAPLVFYVRRNLLFLLFLFFHCDYEEWTNDILSNWAEC